MGSVAISIGYVPLTVDSPILPEQFRTLQDAANVVPNPGAQGSTPLQAIPTALVESFRSTVTKQFRRGLIPRTNLFESAYVYVYAFMKTLRKRMPKPTTHRPDSNLQQTLEPHECWLNSHNSSLCAQLLQSVKIFDDVARRKQSDEVVLLHNRYFIDSVSAHLFHCGPQFRTEIDPI